MGNINVCICSNDAETIAIIERMIVQSLFWDNVELLIFSDISTCLNEFGRALPDIAIVDTTLGDGSGIDLAQEIRGRSLRCQILFVSSNLRMALEVYTVEHTGFVLKEQIQERMPGFLQRCYEKVQQGRASMLVLKYRSEQRMFPQKDILYVESNRRVLEIRTFSRQESVYGTLSDIMGKLNPTYFVQCHKSFLVNLEHVIGFSAEEIELCTGAKIPVSRLYRKTFEELYSRFVKRKTMMAQN